MRFRASDLSKYLGAIRLFVCVCVCVRACTLPGDAFAADFLRFHTCPDIFFALHLLCIGSSRIFLWFASEAAEYLSMQPFLLSSRTVRDK